MAMEKETWILAYFDQLIIIAGFGNDFIQYLLLVFP